MSLSGMPVHMFCAALVKKLQDLTGEPVTVTDRELVELDTHRFESERDELRCTWQLRMRPPRVTVDADPDRVPVEGLGFVHGPQDEFGTKMIDSALATGEWRRLGWSAAALTLDDEQDRRDQ